MLRRGRRHDARAAAETAGRRRGRRIAMDILSIIGVVLGLVAIVGGSVLKGSGIAALWNAADFLIVIDVTFGAVLAQVRLPAFLHGFSILRWVFSLPDALVQRVW